MTQPSPAPLRRCHPPTVRRLSFHAHMSSSAIRSLRTPEQCSGFALGPYRDDSCLHCSIPRVHDHLLPSVHYDVVPRQDGQVRQRLRQACHPTHDGVDRPPRFPHWCVRKQLSITDAYCAHISAGITSFLVIRMWFGKAVEDFDRDITKEGSGAPQLIASTSNGFVSEYSPAEQSICTQNTDFGSSGLGWLCLLRRSRRLLSGQTSRCRRQGIGSMRQSDAPLLHESSTLHQLRARLGTYCIVAHLDISVGPVSLAVAYLFPNGTLLHRERCCCALRVTLEQVHTTRNRELERLEGGSPRGC